MKKHGLKQANYLSVSVTNFTGTYIQNKLVHYFLLDPRQILPLAKNTKVNKASNDHLSTLYINLNEKSTDSQLDIDLLH